MKFQIEFKNAGPEFNSRKYKKKMNIECIIKIFGKIRSEI